MKRAANSPKGRKPLGRPSSYAPETGAQICAAIANGASLKSICERPGIPGRETVRRWLADNEEFRGNYARAREEQADHYADEIMAIADDPDLDANDKRVRIDARKWVASKLKPKSWGDRIEHQVSGSVEFGTRFIIEVPVPKA